MVVSPIGVLGVNEDAPDTIIDLSNVFDDADILTNADSLTFTVVSNTNPALFNSVGIVGDQLTLSYEGNTFGSSDLAIEARDLAGAPGVENFTDNLT